MLFVKARGLPLKRFQRGVLGAHGHGHALAFSEQAGANASTPCSFAYPKHLNAQPIQEHDGPQPAHHLPVCVACVQADVLRVGVHAHVLVVELAKLAAHIAAAHFFVCGGVNGDGHVG